MSNMLNRWRLWAPEAMTVAIGCVLLARSFSRSYFVLDDFVNIGVYRQMGMSWAYLERSLYSHFLPGYRFGVAFYDRVFGGMWWPAVLGQCLALAGCAVLLMLLARELRVGRTVRLVAVMLFVFSALHGRSVVWFAAALNSWPTNLSVLSVILLHLRYLRTGNWLYVPAAVLALAFGVSAYEQSFFSVAALAALVVLYAPELSGRTGAIRTYVRRNLVAGAGYAVCFVAYWGFYFTGPYRDEIPPRGSVSAIGEYLWYAVFEGYLPGLAGQHISTTSPGTGRTAAILAGVIVVGGIVAVSLLRWQRAWRAWAALAFVLVPHMLLVGVARVGLLGAEYGRELRYFSDVVWLLPVCLLFAAFGGARRSAVMDRAPAVLWRGSAVACIAVVSVFAAWENRVDFERSDGWASRAYFDRAAATVPAGDPEFTGLYETTVPCCIQIPVFAPYAGSISQTLGLFEEWALWTHNPSHVVRDDGTVLAADFVAARALRVPACVELSPDGQSVDLPLGPAERAEGQFVELLWEPGPSGTVHVVERNAAGDRFATHAPAAAFGPAESRAVFPLYFNADGSLFARVSGTGEFCLSAAAVGDPVPRSA